MLDGITNNFYCLFSGTHFIYSSGFIFQIFIYTKEMAHFIKNVLRQLINISLLIIIRIIKRYCYDLFIMTTIIDHRNYADRISPD